MDVWVWIVTLLGSLLVVATLVDVFLTVLHLDLTGIIAGRIHRLSWALIMVIAHQLPRRRRALLALAGPIMLAATSLTWLGLYVLGFTLIVWPHLDEAYRTDAELRSLSFLDALYYSGGTAAVLGFGDITPLQPGQKILAVIEASFGFILISSIVTYLLTLMMSVATRHTLAHRVHSIPQHGTGVTNLLYLLQNEEIVDLRQRFESLSQALRSLQARVHQFPVLGLYYRTRDPIHDLEPIIQTVSGMALAGLVLADDEHYRRLRPAAEELGHAVTAMIGLLARQHLGQDVQHRLAGPQPEAKDYAIVEHVKAQVERELGAHVPAPAAALEAALVLAFRSRIFLEALDHLTHWRLDHPFDELSAPGVSTRSTQDPVRH